MNISIARESDLEKVVEMLHPWAIKKGYEIKKDDIKKEFKSVLDKPKGVLLLLHDFEKLIGLVSGIIEYHFWEQAWIAEDHWYYVEPEHRKKGAARVLHDAFVAWAKAQGCKEVIGNIVDAGDMDPLLALSLAKKNGFTIHKISARKRI